MVCPFTLLQCTIFKPFAALFSISQGVQSSGLGQTFTKFVGYSLGVKDMSFLLHPCKKYQGFRPFTAFFSHTLGVQGGVFAGSFSHILVKGTRS